MPVLHGLKLTYINTSVFSAACNRCTRALLAISKVALSRCQACAVDE